MARRGPREGPDRTGDPAKDQSGLWEVARVVAHRRGKLIGYPAEDLEFPRAIVRVRAFEEAACKEEQFGGAF